MKPLHYILSCSILAAVALLSCSKETETLFGNQEKKIESYVQTLLKSHEGAFVCYQDGVTRVTVKRGQRFCREFVYNQLYGSDHYLGRVRFQHFQNRHGTAFGGRIGRWTPPRVAGRKGRRRVLYPLFRQIWLR